MGTTVGPKTPSRSDCLAMLPNTLWPARPAPYPDELLSSWLVRLAYTHGLKVQTFCSRAFGNQFQIWNRDIDRLAPAWLLDTLSQKTGKPLTQVMATTLRAYEGKLYPNYHASGPLRWLLPLQIFHRKRLGYGLQFCPHCLASDPEPYYRRAWRVALYTFCPRHHMLLDRCPECQQGIAFHRQELGKPTQWVAYSLAFCSHCGFDLRLAPTTPAERWNERTFQSWEKALRLIQAGAPDSTRFDYDKLAILHHICALMVSKRLAPKLLPYLWTQTGQQSIPLNLEHRWFEQHNLQERHHLLGLGWWLIGRWPSRLRRAWHHQAVRYNVLSRDFTTPPATYVALLQEIAATLALPHNSNSLSSVSMLPSDPSSLHT